MASGVTRRVRRGLFLLSAICLASSHAAHAQTYPAKPLRVIVPFAPGGATDSVARMVAPKLSENLGQSVVVENRAGGATTIGMDFVAKSPPDGYTLGVANLSFAVNPVLLSKMPYNTEKDFVPVGLVASVPFVMAVHPSVPAKSIKELVALAKARPGALNYSSSGNGSATQMATELFRYLTGIDIVHVPFTGGGPALVSALSGEVSIYCASIPAMLPHFNSGRLRPLAITTIQRDPSMPQIPTMIEAGVPGYDAREWTGIVAPAATPRAIVTRLNQEIVKALSAPELSKRFAAVGAHPVGSTPEEFAAHVQKELAMWAKVIKAANIRIE
ncbi:MAG: tripartite tricarboxylate transporter substrate binding protein [Burkholderiales bacterium]